MKTEMARKVIFDKFGVDCVIRCSSICYRALGLTHLKTLQGQKRERTCRPSFRSETESRFALNGIGNHRLGGVTYFHFWNEGVAMQRRARRTPWLGEWKTDAGAYKFCGRRFTCVEKGKARHVRKRKKRMGNVMILGRHRV
jgi:hypothetical protein